MPRLGWKSFAAVTAVTAAFAIVSPACQPRGGTDIGNGATVTFDVGKFKRQSAQQTRDPGGGLVLANGVRVDRFWISVGGYTLNGHGECGDRKDGEADLPGPLIANLVDADPAKGTSSPLDLRSGDYCRLKVELEAVTEGRLPQSAPAGLLGAVLLLEGARGDGAPFSVRSERKVKIHLDAAGDDFELSGNVPLMVAFELEELTDALDLDAFDDDEDIVIDDKTNVNRLAAFEKSLRKTTGLFRDDDEDGALSEEETDDVLALGSGDVAEDADDQEP